MIRPFALYVGLRYTLVKRKSRFISFISLASMLGIALGVAVLITVLSVMNGFDYQIRHRFFAIAPAVTVLTGGIRAAEGTPPWPFWRQKIAALPDVKGVAPYVSGQVMLISHGEIAGIEAVGIIPTLESEVSQLAEKMRQGQVTSLQPGRYHLIIGMALAKQLGLRVGDQINVLTPETSVTLLGVFPRYRRFTISGLFHTGNGFGFETSVAYLHMQDAAQLFATGRATRGFHIKLEQLYRAPHVTTLLQHILPPYYQVTNWTVQFGAFFQALAMEKTMLFIILLLIVAVAVFNLVSTLVMVVNDKRADIAILRTLGASPGMIMRTIMTQGAIIGLVGTLLGLACGLLLATYATEISNGLQHFLGVHLIQSSVYFVDFLPSRIQWQDVITVSLLAFILSILATLYPAWLAFRTQPAEALRYE